MQSPPNTQLQERLGADIAGLCRFHRPSASEGERQAAEWVASRLRAMGLDNALVFVPFYFRSQFATLPEFLERRYSPLARSIMAFMAILAALLIHIGVSLYAGSQVFQAFFGVPIWLSIVIISAVTAIYTVVGGLRAVVVTETIQTVILLGGAVLITWLALATDSLWTAVLFHLLFNAATVAVRHLVVAMGVEEPSLAFQIGIMAVMALVFIPLGLLLLRLRGAGCATGAPTPPVAQPIENTTGVKP